MKHLVCSKSKGRTAIRGCVITADSDTSVIYVNEEKVSSVCALELLQEFFMNVYVGVCLQWH
jgi:hypothetical protein